MLDCFALLKEPRRPWLDPQHIQSKFRALSAEVHPDRVHAALPEERVAANRRFAELNAACQCLRSSKERVRHLLELERGVQPEQLKRLPSSDADYYFRVGQLCRDVDQFLLEKAAIKSPLLQVRFFERAMVWREQLEQVQAALKNKLIEMESELKALNAAWEASPELGAPERTAALPLDRLEQLYRALSYVTRWSEQVGDRIVQLSL